MKILLINYTDAGGGAAIASYRLLNALRNNGIDATLGVVKKQTADQNVVEIPLKKHSFAQKVFAKIIEKFWNPIWKRIKKPFMFRTSNGILHSTNFKSKIDVNWINKSDYDVVHLHWICSDMISIKDIARIKKPLVWTMHDTWPFCGAEHYPNMLENDMRYREGYTKKNKPTSTKGTDLCRKVWNKKKKYLSSKEITFISPSNWEKNCINESALFKDKTCFVIPNILPGIFAPLDRLNICDILGIPKDKKVIGFGAAYDIDNPKGVKGSYYLLEALKCLKNPEEYFIEIFGNASSAFLSKLNIPYFASGFISNESILAMLYNACHVFVCPSIIENLPFTCLESIFCGVPVTAFNVGGIPDIVEHKKTGYLAKPYESSDLVNGIEYCLQNKEKLSENCLEKAKKDFSSEESVKKYIKVYNYAIKFEKQK